MIIQELEQEEERMTQEMTEQEAREKLSVRLWELMNLCDEVRKDIPAEGMGQNEYHILWFVQRLNRVGFWLIEELHTGRRTVGLLTSCPEGETKDVDGIFQILLPSLKAWLLKEVSKASEDIDLAAESRYTLHALMRQLED